MAIPPPVVAAVRQAWHWQWLQLMGGLGPADAEGNYRRPPAAFATPPECPASAGQPGRHLLIVGRSCPWAHRAWLVWTLRELEGSIELLVVEPDPKAGRWRFVEPFEGALSLVDLYRRCGSDPRARATVPLLYDRVDQRIVVNESARLIELLNRWPAPASAPDLEPIELAEPIDRWRDHLQGAVNDGVYRCGFARHQAAYDRAEAELFAAFEALELSLAGGSPWLCGDRLSLADVVLFPTLIRLELVYAPLFGCSRRPLWQFPALWDWRRRFHRLAGVAATCFPAAWRRDYFGSLFPLQPSGIVPAGPDLATLVEGCPPGSQR
ncbi:MULTISPECIES: glutathione S-transferase C-terminal domain-containing protein [unclassified Synechococcus]|uniref:glutathione S-transferase C-terminal domain-containing protein n=1 Tax=unclassified Synechococcus TaxID=2626047 RepID=UPI0021A70526|nr:MULTISPECIES: glutathione S-transferase C-terminal domain-containing protein [unclassified Synechococcus]MCT0213422.1 glutathione S-transferase C-terminal domain-containing protein [Synechococcus sp. CS-1326]MCT0232724.1 glutathione S-transferase C-terminal domain-containing protein [Synechococcus sp. CS-1327]